MPKHPPISCVSILGVILLATLLGVGETPAAQAAPRKIVLIGGAPDGHPAGMHEYAAVTQLIKRCLDGSAGVRAANPQSIVVAVSPRGWPEDEKLLADADAIVLITSGPDRVEKNHPLLVGDHLATLEKQMQRGCGLAAIHYSTFAPNRIGPSMLEWLGGYFDYQSGPAANGWYSKIQTWKASVQPAKDHAICRGVAPFEINEEFYYNIRFRPEDARLAKIATVRPPGEDADYAVGWAVERAGGGRGFGFTGGHFLDNWKNENFRRLLLNAILWTARAEVPPQGVDSQLAAVDGPAPTPGNAKTGATDAAPITSGVAPRSADTLGESFGASLDARQGVLEVKADPSYSTAPRTVEMWARLDSGEQYNLLVAQSPKESPEHWELFSMRGSGQFSAFLPGYAPDHVHSDIVITDGKWRYLAMTFDGHRVRLFVDAKQVAEQEVRRHAPPGEVGALWIGGYPLGGLRCKGRIDELRFSSIARQIDAIPREPFAADAHTLALWRFDSKDKGGYADVVHRAVAAVPPISKATKASTRIDDRASNWKEADSQDDRLNQTDTGQFYSGTVRAFDDTTIKGIAIRVGDKNQAAVLFDTDLLRMSCGWQGKFLKFDGFRFGLLRPATPEGARAFRTARRPGWARSGAFDDPRPHKPAGPLPREWAHYQGLYLHDHRVTLAYSVGQATVRESPWVETHGAAQAITRTLEITGPTSVAENSQREDMLLENLVCEGAGAKDNIKMEDGIAVIRPAQGDGSITAIALVHGEGASLAVETEVRPPASRVLLRVPLKKDAERRAIKLLVWSGKRDDLDAFKALVAASPAPEDLTPLCQPGAPRWTAPVVTAGKLSDKTGAYVVDTLTVPFENPYHSLMFLSGHDFFANGDAAVSTLHGDVWRVGGIDATLGRLTWKRLATGLFQPLGLKIVDNEVFVLGRDQITHLHDFDHDGEADFYENFNNDGEVSQNGHEFATCLETDSQGNFYYLRGDSHGATSQDGSLLRVVRDGSRISVFATGLRNANGMGIGPDDTITVSPQEGNWTPGSGIFAVREGDFCGMMDAHHRSEPPKAIDPPLCWIPRPLDNSSGGQAWAPATGWGPLGGDMLHLSYGRATMLAVLRETVAGRQQGAVMPLPLEFDSGVIRGRFSPRDGQLYVTGLQGWQTNAKQDGCFQRVRYTGAAVDLPTAIHFVDGGALVTFSRALDPAAAEDVDNYDVQAWNYRWSSTYGSPDFKASDAKAEGHDDWPVSAAALQADGKTVYLAIKEIKPVMQIGLRTTLKSRDGGAFESALYGTIHALGAAPSDVRTTPAHRPSGQAAEVDPASLAPGLKLSFTQVAAKGEKPIGGHDARVARLAALFVPKGAPPSSMLPAGRFEAVAEGYSKVDLKGTFRFSLAGVGAAQLAINGKNVLNADGPDLATVEPVEVVLHKGYNRVRLSYASPGDADAACRVLWSSSAFEPEPLPPGSLWHDVHDAELIAAEQLRAGRELFASRHCAKCHATGTGAAGAMPELAQEAPSLVDVGRRLRAEWLQAWLVNPRDVRDDATMPSGLRDKAGATARQQAADIVAYLASLGGAAQHAPTALDAQRVGRGEVIYEDLGCIQCHSFNQPEDADEFGRSSLYYSGEKFHPGELNAFLEKPRGHYAWTRMPDFHLTADERAAIVDYVLAKSMGEHPPAREATTADAKRGKQLFESTGCRQCHRIDAGPLPAPTANWPATSDAKPGCLATVAPKSDKSPNFQLSDTQRDALKSFVAAGPASLGHDAPAEFAARQMAALNCSACHARDGKSTHAAAILDDEGTQGFAPELLPSLTWAGEKLQVDWTRRLLDGSLSYRARPWLKGRMPAFPGRGELLAHGLAAEHGMAPTDGPAPLPNAASAPAPSADLIAIGRALSLKQGGLDCRQCHSIDGVTQKQENNAQGISFPHVAERVRIDYYRRWMLDPLRIDPQSKMPRITTDRQRTAAVDVLGGDARRQFDALWEYIHSLPPTGANGAAPSNPR